MTQFKTLAKNDPEFKSYLLGTFASDSRAIPVKSLNVTTAQETVTFEIRPLSEVVRPPFLLRWAQTLKLNNFLLVALPLFLVLYKAYIDLTPFSPALAILCSLGVLFIHASVNLRNDFLDYLSGLDRVDAQGGSRAIQNGWLTAQQTKIYSYVFLALGFLCGLPAILTFTNLLFLIGILIVFGFIGTQSYRFGLKYRLWTELTAFLFLGPLLIIGFQMGVGVRIDIESLIFGVITGWLAVYLLHLKNFSQIILNNQIGFVNSITILGFEKAKSLISVWWVVFLFLLNSYHFFYTNKKWFVAFLLFSSVLSYFHIRSIRSIQSPVSSNFLPMIGNFKKLAYTLISFWLAELLTQILVVEIGG